MIYRLLKKIWAWIVGPARTPEKPVTVVVPEEEVRKARNQAAPCIMFDLTPVED